MHRTPKCRRRYEAKGTIPEGVSPGVSAGRRGPDRRRTGDHVGYAQPAPAHHDRRPEVRVIVLGTDVVHSIAERSSGVLTVAQPPIQGLHEGGVLVSLP